MIYAELQTTTHFSFLRGASSSDELFAKAAELEHLHGMLAALVVIILALFLLAFVIKKVKDRK